MKRLVLIVILLFCGSVYAQSNRNVLGAPVYYDTLGNVIGQQASDDSIYRLPKHHFHNRLENDFSAYFLEGQFLFGSNDMAVGAQFAYVPRRWGFFVGGDLGVNSGYLKAGPVLRLSDCGNIIDWQLYAGIIASRTLGGEVGIRMAAPRLLGDFCWTSVSLGVGYANSMTYFTMGFSLTLSTILALSIW